MNEKLIFGKILEYKNNSDNLEKLRKIYSRNGIIPFIGAGLSSPFDVKMWKEFLISCCTEEKIEKCISELIENDDYEGAAEYLYKQNEKYFEQRLREEYTVNEIDKKTFSSSAISLLPKIFRGPVVTTNFDRIIEMTYEKYKRNIKNINILEADMFYSYLSDREECLFKIHGDVNDFHSIVITEEQYEEHYSRNEKFIDALGTLFKTNTFLFLGCSLKRDRTMKMISDILKGMGRKYHYALVASPALSSEGIYLENKQCEEDEIFQRLEKFHIIPIWFPDGEFKYVNYLLIKISNWDSRIINFKKRSFYISSIKNSYEGLKEIKNYIPLCGTNCYENESLIANANGEDIDLSALLVKHRIIIILGEPGSGKTTTIKNYVLKLATMCEANNNALLPLYIKLYKWADSDFELFLQNVWENIYKMDGDISTLLRNRDVVLFLDGLNEIGDNINEKANIIFDWINRNKKIYIVLTCRTIEYNQHESKLKKFPYIKMLPMNDNQVDKFVEMALDSQKTVFLEQLDKYTNEKNQQETSQDKSMTNIFLDLRTNPFFLGAIIECFKLNNKQAIYNPYEIAKVITNNKWKRSYVYNKYKDISYEEVEKQLSMIAYYNVKNNLNISKSYTSEAIVINNEIIEAACFAELIELQGNLITFKHQIFLEYFASIELCNIGISSIIEELNIRYMDYGSKAYDPTFWPFYHPIPSQWHVPTIFSLGKYVHEKNEIENIMYEIIRKNVFVAITCMLATSFIGKEIIRKCVRYIIDYYADQNGALQIFEKLNPLIQDLDLIEKIDIHSDRFHPTEAMIILISRRNMNSTNVINLLLEILNSFKKGLIIWTYPKPIRIPIRIAETLGAIGNIDAFNTLLPYLNDPTIPGGILNIRPISHQSYFSIIRIARREPHESTNVLMDMYSKKWEQHIIILDILYNFNSRAPIDFYFNAMEDSSSQVRGLALDIIAHKFGNISRVVERFIMAINDINSYSKCLYYTDEQISDNPKEYKYYNFSKHTGDYWICFEALNYLIEWHIVFTNRIDIFLQACKMLFTTKCVYDEYMHDIISKFMNANQPYGLSEQDKNIFIEYTSNFEEFIHESDEKNLFAKWTSEIVCW